MREVKFRAWDKEKKMLRKVTRISFSTKYIEVEPVTLEMLDMYEPVLRTGHYEIMQCTNLKDKNNVEIYEGDIVHWMKEFISPMDMRTKHKIDSNKEVHQKESGEWGMGEVGNTLSEELLNVEVIGNIYENPELLGCEST